MKRDDDDSTIAEDGVVEVVHAHQVWLNDPKASVAPPSTHTHTEYDVTSGMTIQCQPEIRSIPDTLRKFPQHDGV